MRTIEIPDLSDEIYAQIEKLARVRGKSVAQQAAEFLQKAVGADEQAEEQLLADVRADRDAMAKRGVFATDDDIKAAKNWGRE
jgi:hypothetical protein